MKRYKLRKAFTLAEVLITIAIIGVVAVMTLSVLLTNVQELVRKEQVRTAKYKLTLATDKMKTMGLIGPYNTTQAFVNELRKHLKIAKVCNNSNLSACWPTDYINVPNLSGSLRKVQVDTLTNGSKIYALGVGTKNTTTVGIVTGDGVPMIMTYSPKCTPLEPERTYNWSTYNNKPETNATTNCISAIFDVNGKAGPNRIGKDVRTLNSVFGAVHTIVDSISEEECLKVKKMGIVKYCHPRYIDRYSAIALKCHQLGLNLPSRQTLANIAGSMFGITDMQPNTRIKNMQRDSESSVADFYVGSGLWSNEEIVGSFFAYERDWDSNGSYEKQGWRNDAIHTYCVGD